ncbi:MAG: mannose-1-phosphate guanylyltransferase [Bacteroidales bacterium]|nr:mannose-1-phosphate guanylyltransferase [Bacteroidales bacterium]
MELLDKNNYCIIMAGGIGSRFWPLSRTACPKQFLDILGVGRTFIQQTWDRFAKIFLPENIFIVTGEDYKELVMLQIPEIPENNILLEPLRRNTAPCIAYACYKIMASNPNANIVVSPSDHYIGDYLGFQDTILKGLDFTKNSNALLTIGITPTRPETGYGYIQVDLSNEDSLSTQTKIMKVKTFTEKPELEMAKVFLESKEFYWNSGIFIWNVKTIVLAFQQLLPDIDTMFNQGMDIYNTPEENEFINKIYPECNSISIDYGIMENHNNVYVIQAKFPWSDLGTWGSLYENSKHDKNENVIAGKNVFVKNSNGCIIRNGDSKIMVVEGLKDFIVAESDEIILIVPKADEQNIKNIVNEVKISLGDEYV